MKPISSRFLKGSGMYYEKTGENAYCEPVYGTGVTISRFLAEAPKKTSITSLGEQANDTLVIYFDSRKSLPLGQAFVAGDKITYRSKDYIVREAQLHPTPDHPHHWVLRLT